MFPADVASKRAALVRHLATMQQNAEMRAMRERRRSFQDAQSQQMDYERVVGDAVRSRIEPLRTFRHQTNDRARMANAVTQMHSDDLPMNLSDGTGMTY